MWSKLLLTPKETMLKGRQLKNAEILWIELKERNKNINLIYVFYVFSRANLNDTFATKYDGVLPRTL